LDRVPIGRRRETAAAAAAAKKNHEAAARMSEDDVPENAPNGSDRGWVRCTTGEYCPVAVVSVARWDLMTTRRLLHVSKKDISESWWWKKKKNNAPFLQCRER
jgi:hypothetical protein